MRKKTTYGKLNNGDKVYISERLMEINNVENFMLFNEEKKLNDVIVSFNGKLVQNEKGGYFQAWHWEECEIEI